MNLFQNRIIKAFLSVFFIFLAAGFSYGQTTEREIEKQIDGLFSNYNLSTPGVAVAVVKDGKVVFKKGYGAANLEYDIPITTKTVFQIASVSKQFTAFAIYLLEKQGKISLEDDVRKYVSELPDYGKIVRIKHLLSHTSGIKDQAALLTLAGWQMDDVTTTEHNLRLVSRQKELNFEPGTRFLYSNSGYTLLAEIVKRASGVSFAEYARKNIFEPLGMNDTQFYDDYERIVKNRADSYELIGGTYKKIALSNSSPGASNLYTTVEDMTKWVLNFENPKAGDADLIKRFDAPSLLNNGERVVWGVTDGETVYHAKGQNNWNYRGLRLMSHGGHSAAFRSFLGRFPEKRFAVVALSNDEHYLNFVTSIKIAEFYLQSEMKPLSVLNNSTTPNKPAEKSNADLKDFEGRFYNEELDAGYTAKVAGGKLFLAHIRFGDIELADAGKDKFSARIVFPVEIEFVRNETGAVTGFRVSNFGAKNVKFNKLK